MTYVYDPLVFMGFVQSGGSGDVTQAGANAFTNTNSFASTTTINGTISVNAVQTFKQQTITLNGGTQTIALASGSTIILTGNTANSTIAYPASSTVDSEFTIIDQTTGAWTRSANGGTIDGLSASQTIPAGGGSGTFHSTASTVWVTLAVVPSGAVSKGAIVGADTIVNTTTETVMGNVKTFAAGEPIAGQVWEGFFVALINVDAATPGNLTLRWRWGGIAGTLVGVQDTTGTSLTTSTVNGLAFVHARIEFLTVGAAGTVRVDGRFSIQKNGVAALVMGGYFGSTGATSVTVDTTTAAKDLCFTMQFSSVGSTNTNGATIRQGMWTRVK